MRQRKNRINDDDNNNSHSHIATQSVHVRVCGRIQVGDGGVEEAVATACCTGGKMATEEKQEEVEWSGVEWKRKKTGSKEEG
mmetsp:Transcript_5982/g.8525  ORF Transcript_5982/g.8525 Transcript_5982/m.8525 type:complete len:82 (-) Transcript_5982:63-308(-)